jgi:hypothetical protein
MLFCLVIKVVAEISSIEVYISPSNMQQTSTNHTSLYMNHKPHTQSSPFHLTTISQKLKGEYRYIYKYDILYTLHTHIARLKPKPKPKPSPSASTTQKKNSKTHPPRETPLEREDPKNKRRKTGGYMPYPSFFIILFQNKNTTFLITAPQSRPTLLDFAPPRPRQQ